MKGTILTPILRSLRGDIRGVMALMTLLCALSGGCGDKKEAQTPPPSGATTAPAAGAPQGKVTTGADPDKAPSYPNMYGKPAGSK
jgi:hypothetical protein